MSRQWLGVPPRALCDDHLAGELNEHHKYVGGLRAGNVRASIMQASLGNVVPTRLTERFDKLAAEHERRHGSAYKPLPDVPDIPIPASASPERNRRDLRQRCDECAARMHS